MTDQPTSLVPSREMLKRVMEEVVPFNRMLGMQVGHVEEGACELRLPFKPEFIGDITKPAVHGGVISALLDAAGGCAVFSRIEAGDRVSTIDLLVDYVRPCPPQTLIARARVVRVGGRVALVQLEAHPENDANHTVATGRATYNIKRAKSAERASTT